MSEIATLSFGPIMTILGIFTMLTSYFVLSYSLQDTFKNDIKLKKISKNTPALPLVLELGDYIQGIPIKHYEEFLPWNEFCQLAELYGTKPVKAPYTKLIEEYFREVGSNLKEKVQAYIFGGFNLVIEKLKEGTKDVDVIVLTQREFKHLIETLKNLSFSPVIETHFKHSAILEKNSLRIDIFYGNVGGVKITENMVKRSSKGIIFNKLVLKFMSLEDVVFLKSITSRERDIEDIARIILKRKLKWKIILQNILEQEEPGKYAFEVLDTIEILEEAYNVKVSTRFKSKLKRLALKYLIKKALEIGYKTPKEIGKILEIPPTTVEKYLEELSSSEH